VRIVHPDSLMTEASEVLAPVVDRAVVIGAVAMRVILSGWPADAGDRQHVTTLIAPTRDVDLAVGWPDAHAIVSTMEKAGLEPSEEPGERGFTWAKGDFKIQLVARPGMRRMGENLSLPVNAATSVAASHNEPVAFAGDVGTVRFLCVTPSALLALKGSAFGRRDHTGEPVERDFHDAYLLIADCGDEIIAELKGHRDRAVIGMVRSAAQALSDDENATRAAAGQAVLLDPTTSVRTARASVLRTGRTFLSELDGLG